MTPETFERKIRARFEDRGLFVRRCLHPRDARRIALGLPLAFNEKRFPYCVFRRSPRGAVNMIWIVEWPDRTPKPLTDAEIEHMSRCDNYRYWRNRKPNKQDLDNMDRDLFRIDEEEERKRKSRAEWREYRKREIVPRFRHDLLRNAIIRTESTTRNPVRSPQKKKRRRGKIIFSTGG